MKTSEMKINEAGTTYDNGAWVNRYNRFVPIFSFRATFVKENKGTL